MPRTLSQGRIRVRGVTLFTWPCEPPHGLSRSIGENRGDGDKQDRKDNEKSEHVTDVTIDDLLVLCDENFINLACDETSWMDNDGLVQVVGMGYVSLVTNNETKLTLKDVRHAPNIRLNLIFVRKLDGDGMVNVTKYDDSTKLWHMRLSHMSEKELNCLVKKNQLSSLKNAILKNYVHCLVGKQRIVLFKCHPPSRKLDLLELVHSNVCGPLNGRSHSGALYFVTFINDCLSKLWVYALKRKDHVLDVFKQFQSLVERERDWEEFEVNSSKLDAKTQQCIFTSYGHDKFRYGLYDLIEKKLVRSIDVVFFENRTIENIYKTNKTDPQSIGDLIDSYPVPLAPPPNPIQDDMQEDNIGDQYSIDEYVLLTDGEEPECYEEAMESECKVYRLNQEENLTPQYKARLVVKGYNLKKWIDFEEIFSLVVKMSSISTILSLTAYHDLEIEQMNVKTVFFHGDLEEDLYIKQLECFVAQGKKDYVHNLRKSFQSVFVKRFSGDDIIILWLYVDDILIVARNASRITMLKQELSKSIMIKDLGLAKKIIDI
ncbi:hypothetical protein CXB51_008026 [Gossypium anomalum]|uniref:GAG-pre-integrase domain-containing protein n=1 Tax=Gossypium anomalum TaxID=47600 RepID=A0A8J5Z8K3_9ROSI|nr:hypothetical protein CXB51_008026 [Gossypium anomalum]